MMRSHPLIAAVLVTIWVFPAMAQIQLDQAQFDRARSQSVDDAGDTFTPSKPKARPTKMKPLGPLKATVRDLQGHGRLIMPSLPRGQYTFAVEGDKLTIALPKDVTIAEIGRRPRNALSINWGPTVTEVIAIPGTQIRVRRIGRGLVVDLLDPPPQTASALAPQPSPSQVPPSLTLSALGKSPIVLPTSPDLDVGHTPITPKRSGRLLIDGAASSKADPVRPFPARLEDPRVADGPVRSTMPVMPPFAPGTVTVGGSEISQLPPVVPGLALRRSVRIEGILGASGPAILLPAEHSVGLAAFQSGSEMLFVLDVPIEFQISPPSLDPVFVRMSSSRMQDATVVRVPGASSDFGISRGDRGWIISSAPALEPIVGIASQLVEISPKMFSMRFSMAEPSRVVSIMDPETGGTLLVGTQTSVGQAWLGDRHQAQFILVPTLQGLVVSPNSDDIRLRREADGFGLSAGPTAGGTIVSGMQARLGRMVTSAPLSRLFEIPVDTVQGLYTNMNERLVTAGEAPALTRSKPRLRVAEAFVALGLGVEAQSVLDVVAAADPSFVERPETMGLRAVAALLAHRLDQAGAMLDSRLNGTQEIDLWRALLQVERDEVSAGDARSLALCLPLLLTYSQPLQDRFLPAALEAMAIGGQAAAADSVLKGMPEDHRLDLARGIALEMTEHAPEALKAYDEVAGRSDRLPRYKALVRAIELRLKGGQIDAKGAADALERSLYSWRGARQELSLRTRIADLRRRAGQWQQAVAMLRDGSAAFPEDHVQIDREIAATFTALLTGDGAERMVPADFVALYDQNQAFVQGVAWDEHIGTKFVEQLIALGLQGRAEPIMAGLVARASNDGHRVLLGMRLASLRMTSNDPAGAIAALADTVPPPGLPVDPPLVEARQLLYARAESERGNKDLALSMLASLPTVAADEVRADIYASRADWPHVVEVLTSLERQRSFAPEPGVDQQALVIRIAIAATLSSDAATLRRLTALYGAAMAKSASAGLFQLMTSAPVHGTEDLPRAFREIQTARQVQSDLTGLKFP